MEEITIKMRADHAAALLPMMNMGPDAQKLIRESEGTYGGGISEAVPSTFPIWKTVWDALEAWARANGASGYDGVCQRAINGPESMIEVGGKEYSESTLKAALKAYVN